MDWIERVAEIVRTAGDATQGWSMLLQVCKAERPSELWDELARPAAADDAHSAARWLVSELRNANAPKPMRGLYLGLDTLNMRDGAGHNVQIGATAACDPFKSDGEWAWNCEWYGTRHLIRGLVDLKRTYEHERWRDVRDVADYALFLGYSGLVLSDALASLEGREPLLAAWGFHDGDLFLLGRRTSAGFERLCSVL
jgi:hypothetical protein